LLKAKLSVLIHFCNSITLSREEIAFLAFLTGDKQASGQGELECV